MRKEHDFLGEMEVPDDVYYGVQTLRARENFNITGEKLDKSTESGDIAARIEKNVSEYLKIAKH